MTSERIQRSDKGAHVKKHGGQETPLHYTLKPVRTPVAIFGSLGVCIYGPASRHWRISYSPIHLT